MTEEIVKRGYNKIAKDYHEWRQKFDNSKQLKQFSAYLPKNSKILDLGCGAGIPVTKFLADKGYNVTGVDISSSMIKLAKENVANAKFIKSSIIKMKFKENSFDGLVAVYSIIHIPKEKQRNLFIKLKKILKPNGIFLMSLGTQEGESKHKFFGTNMFWSNYSIDTYLKMIKKIGFKIIFNKIVKTAGEENYWILAKNIK